jgi:hypothetical protein
MQTTMYIRLVMYQGLLQNQPGWLVTLIKLNVEGEKSKATV